MANQIIKSFYILQLMVAVDSKTSKTLIEWKLDCLSHVVKLNHNFGKFVATLTVDHDLMDPISCITLLQANKLISYHGL